MARRWHQFKTKKIVSATTSWGLKKKVQENETRNWKAITDLNQHRNGIWVCVMELQPR